MSDTVNDRSRQNVALAASSLGRWPGSELQPVPATRARFCGEYVSNDNGDDDNNNGK